MSVPKIAFFALILGAHAPDHTAAQKGRGCPEVRLKVTINSDCVDFQGISTHCAIQNDGKGIYVDGSDNVVAYLTKAGGLIIETNTKIDAPPGSAIRSLTLNWMPSLDQPPGKAPEPMSYIPDYHIEAVKRTANPVPIQSLPEDGSACYKVHLMFRDLTKDVQWINNFRLGWDDDVAGMSRQLDSGFVVRTRGF